MPTQTTATVGTAASTVAAVGREVPAVWLPLVPAFVEPCVGTPVDGSGVTTTATVRAG